MIRPMIEMTRDPLPAGEQSVYLEPGGGCPVCRCIEYTIGADLPIRMTRSVTPRPDGSWDVHVHHEWCPQWTNVVPELACPLCGAPIEEIEVNSVALYRVPGGGLVEYSEASSRRYSRGWLPAGSRASTVGLGPCGHLLERVRGHDIDGFLTASDEVRTRRRRTEADAVLASHMDLLAAARAAGAGPLVEAYEDAVRRSSANAPGLLQALRVLAGE